MSSIGKMSFEPYDNGQPAILIIGNVAKAISRDEIDREEQSLENGLFAVVS